MKLTRCHDQNKQTLEEFYTELSHHENVVCREGSKAILDLLPRLRALQNQYQVFGLTSHLRLCLLAQDTHQSPWYVIISALDKRNFSVEYLLPSHACPWPRAYVRGETGSEDEAVQMIEIAIQNSEGWANHGATCSPCNN